MKQTYLHKIPSSRTLTLLFGGWGSGVELFADCCPKDSDLMLCYDYHDLDFDRTVLKAYASIRVVAWSMGVWAASRLFSGGTFEGLPVESATAFGGTVELADDRFGIPSAIFEATVSGMSPVALKKFRRRMCGAFLAHFESHIPGRCFEDLDGELKAVAAALDGAPKSLAAILDGAPKAVAAALDGVLKASAIVPGPGTAQSGFPTVANPDEERLEIPGRQFFWTQAYVGNADLIFPPANQIHSWERLGVPFREIDSPHYNPEVFEKLTGGQSID